MHRCCNKSFVKGLKLTVVPTLRPSDVLSGLQVALSGLSVKAFIHRSAKLGVRVLTVDNINTNVRKMEYAVRGPIVTRATEIAEQMKKGEKMPFNNILWTNLGDCHALGQQPLTFLRQVIAVCAYTPLLEDKSIPADVKERAKSFLASCGGGSVGAYSESAGVPIVRQSIAKFMENRDGGVPALESDIVLTSGASEAVTFLLNLLNYSSDSNKPAGIMIPIPLYPLYSATLEEYSMHQIHYYLDEDKDWALDINELKRAIGKARNVCEPRGIVIINPGNPTGAVLTEKNIKEVIHFAKEEKLFILTDEVYQENIYDKSTKFHSFKKVMMNMGKPYNEIEMASLMSVSKGTSGECGLRGGYFELVNTNLEVKQMLMKAISCQLCSSILGQAAMECIVNPPKEGDPSYDLFHKEQTTIMQSFKERSKFIVDEFNKMEGMQCNKVAGAMYAFPRLLLPDAAISKAESLGMNPDFFYVSELLEKTGICVIPGSGFGQKPGTYHFRTTILPPMEMMKEMIQRMNEFHTNFMKTYN